MHIECWDQCRSGDRVYYGCNLNELARIRYKDTSILKEIF